MNQKSHVLCLLQPVHSTGIEAVPASSGRHCREIQEREPARSALTSPSVAFALLSKHRLRCNEICRGRSCVNLVISTLKLRSGNCVKWRPPKNDGPSCINLCHFPNFILCRRWSSTSSNTQPTNSPGAIDGFLTDSKLTEEARFINVHLVAFLFQMGDDSCH